MELLAQIPMLLVPPKLQAHPRRLGLAVTRDQREREIICPNNKWIYYMQQKKIQI